MKKSIKLYVSIIVVFLASSGLSATGATPSPAFHRGGTNECQECHTNKNADSRDFAQMLREIKGLNRPRSDKSSDLRGSDESSTCLRCHEAPRGTRNPTGHYVATNISDLRGGLPPSQMTPGGDFGWLKKSYFWKPPDERGPGHWSSGYRHGHSIVAIDSGYDGNSDYYTAPGGSYPARNLSCISCHDPHGTIAKGPGDGGSYRLLGGKGYSPSSAGGMVFAIDPPVAVAPRGYNRAESASDTRVAYGKGMSEWCTNCHANSCSGSYGHAVCNNARFGVVIAANYNAYRKTGDLNGMESRSYTSLVPFEEGTDNLSLLDQHANGDGRYTSGPGASANVMCLTCHRAHASAWDHMARWNMTTQFITYKGNYPGIDNGSPVELAQGRTAVETKKAYYDRPATVFAPYQRSLCDKCHPKD